MMEVTLLIWLICVNGAPILLAKVLGERFNQPIDGNYLLKDGRPIFGRSKTVRGFLAAVLVSIGIGYLCEFPLALSATFGSLAMFGDLTSSFIKRRLGYQPSAMALGIDQIPESLFPLLGIQLWLTLSFSQIAGIVFSFFCIELILSRFLFWLKIRKTPY